jgi:hypothetical protein
MPLVALAAGLVVLALILGVLLGMALAKGVDEGDRPALDDADANVDLGVIQLDEPTMFVGQLGAVTELRTDGYWYRDGKRVVSP